MKSGLFVRIESAEYAVQLLADAVTLTKLGQARHGGGTVYTVRRRPGGLSCDCPDRTYAPRRPAGCKHMQAVAACGLSVLLTCEQPAGELVQTWAGDPADY